MEKTDQNCILWLFENVEMRVNEIALFATKSPRESYGMDRPLVLVSTSLFGEALSVLLVLLF